jgi:hypothetical protein
MKLTLALGLLCLSLTTFAATKEPSQKFYVGTGFTSKEPEEFISTNPDNLTAAERNELLALQNFKSLMDETGEYSFAIRSSTVEGYYLEIHTKRLCNKVLYLLTLPISPDSSIIQLLAPVSTLFGSMGFKYVEPESPTGIVLREKDLQTAKGYQSATQTLQIFLKDFNIIKLNQSPTGEIKINIQQEVLTDLFAAPDRCSADFDND